MDKDILKLIAQKHNLNLLDVEEIWKLFCAKIAVEIANPDKKDENGLYDIKKFKIIHIEHLGKFIPCVRNIKYANRGILAKTKDK